MVKQLTSAGSAFLVLVLVPAFAAWVFAGDLEPPAGPDDPGSAMHTLEDAYNRLDSGDAGEKRTGGFTAPSSVPGSTGHTMDEVMAKMPAADDTDGAAPEDVAAGKAYWSLRTDGRWGQQTGTSTICANSCTGSLSAGGRWCDRGDGTVKDMTTGLVWLKDASWGCSFPLWTDGNSMDALYRTIQVKNGTPDSLADGSVEGDWRLPTKEELYGLANGTEAIRVDSMGAFLDVNPLGYWTSTTNANDPSNAWCVSSTNGYAVNFCRKTENLCVWPVRRSN